MFKFFLSFVRNVDPDPHVHSEFEHGVNTVGIYVENHLEHSLYEREGVRSFPPGQYMSFVVHDHTTTV